MKKSYEAHQRKDCHSFFALKLASSLSMTRLVPKAALTSCQPLKAEVRIPLATVTWASLRWTSFCYDSEFSGVHSVSSLLLFTALPSFLTFDLSSAPLSSCTLIKALSEISCKASVLSIQQKLPPLQLLTCIYHYPLLVSLPVSCHG